MLLQPIFALNNSVLTALKQKGQRLEIQSAGCFSYSNSQVFCDLNIEFSFEQILENHSVFHWDH